MKVIIKKGDMILIDPPTIAVDHTEKTKAVVMAETDGGFIEISETYPFTKSAEDLVDAVFSRILQASMDKTDAVIDMDWLEADA